MLWKSFVHYSRLPRPKSEVDCCCFDSSFSAFQLNHSIEGVCGGDVVYFFFGALMIKIILLCSHLLNPHLLCEIARELTANTYWSLHWIKRVQLWVTEQTVITNSFIYNLIFHRSVWRNSKRVCFVPNFKRKQGSGESWSRFRRIKMKILLSTLSSSVSVSNRWETGWK